MTAIFFDTARLKAFSALSKAGKSTIKLEIETTDHFELAYILRQLDQIEAEQKQATKPKKAEAQKAAPLLALPAPAKQLTYRGSANE